MKDDWHQEGWLIGEGNGARADCSHDEGEVHFYTRRYTQSMLLETQMRRSRHINSYTPIHKSDPTPRDSAQPAGSLEKSGKHVYGEGGVCREKSSRGQSLISLVGGRYAPAAS